MNHHPYHFNLFKRPLRFYSRSRLPDCAFAGGLPLRLTSRSQALFCVDNTCFNLVLCTLSFTEGSCDAVSSKFLLQQVQEIIRPLCKYILAPERITAAIHNCL